LTTKVGLDATRPQKDGFEKVDAPEDVKQRLASVLNNRREKEKK
jgi:hypothetical protein